MSRRARRNRRREKLSARLKRKRQAILKRQRLLEQQGWFINYEDGPEDGPEDDLVRIVCP